MCVFLTSQSKTLYRSTIQDFNAREHLSDDQFDMFIVDAFAGGEVDTLALAIT